MRNEFKVPAQRWNKWSDHARRVFNSLYWQMIHNPRLFLPTGVKEMDGWDVTAWNASWIAANAVMEEAEQQKAA